jgi:tRNA-Thr(GGU) m(6)t(6)A37 methyltransferase TsaA
MHLTPIGIIRSPFRASEGAPIQPGARGSAEGTVEVRPEYAAGLRDLEGFDRVWLVYWFDRADGPRLTVIPFLDEVERGLFATRAPCRPNPIGLSSVRLLGVEGCVLRVGDLDVLDGTPLLDIKPYVPRFDCHAVERCGWVDEAPGDPGPADGRFERGR